MDAYLFRQRPNRDPVVNSLDDLECRYESNITGLELEYQLTYRQNFISNP